MKLQDKYGCNIPWTILMDPTSACNLHCTGCWAAEYGNKLNLTFEQLDGIIRQGKELGIYVYIYSGGEPTVRRADIIRLCEKHSDCAFLAFTNGTLIDDAFADDILRVSCQPHRPFCERRPCGGFRTDRPQADRGHLWWLRPSRRRAFSGKDATKVDRSGAYMARYIAKNIVRQGLADKCEVQLSYAIGLAEPLSVRVETFGTSSIPSDDLADAVVRSADLRPAAIIRRFGLDRPIFSRVSCYGHFGSNAADMPWEQTDLRIDLQ